MPRRSRIDAPGALQHIIARGINRQRIFKDDADRDIFLDRLGNILSETQTACFAWAELKISQPAVSRAVRRGEQLAHRNRYSLKD
jgi:hypothetical protein